MNISKIYDLSSKQDPGRPFKFYFFGGRSFLIPLFSNTIDEARQEASLKYGDIPGKILKFIEEV